MYVCMLCFFLSSSLEDVYASIPAVVGTLLLIVMLEKTMNAINSKSDNR